MACNSLNLGIAADCSNNMGGITKVYLTPLSNITSYTESGGTVSAISMTSSTYFYAFNFNRNSATFTENLTKNVEAGSALYEQTVTITIPKRETAKRNALALVAVGDLGCVIKDSNAKYWYLGAVEGVYVSEMTSTSGTAKADGSNYVVTLKGFEVNAAYELASASVITSLVSPSWT